MNVNAEMGNRIGWEEGMWHDLRNIFGLAGSKNTKDCGTSKLLKILKTRFESTAEYNQYVKVVKLRDLKLRVGCKPRREALSEYSALKGAQIIMLHEKARSTLERLSSDDDAEETVHSSVSGTKECMGSG